MLTKQISWGQIRVRAAQFSLSWQSQSGREISDSQTFWHEFFEIFGMRRRTVASFEHPVKNLKGAYSRIDLFWRGVLLVEQKSVGESLERAQSQAFQYINDLINEGNHHDVPRYVIVSDFQTIVLFDLESDESSDGPVQQRPQSIVRYELGLGELSERIKLFSFMRGDKKKVVSPEDPANIKASEKLGKLHDALEVQGFRGTDLEKFLARILFCLFAEDTTIFEPTSFQSFIEDRTSDDGSDLGQQLERLFRVLDTPVSLRQKNLDEIFTNFPYVNGRLFSARLEIADFDRAGRVALLECCKFDWSRISPAVFGSLFQSVMDAKERRENGSHYTNERDILRAIDDVFVGRFRQKIEVAGNNKKHLSRVHHELQNITFFDPACGCGNFLVVAYRELRRLELLILKKLGSSQRVLDVTDVTKISVSQMNGIDILEFPTRIAEVALWIVDHQMNLELGEAFGEYFVRLPLDRAPNIINGNALELNWSEVLAPEECTFIIGNPPFIGRGNKNKRQKEESKRIFGGLKDTSQLDYVACWFAKAARYIHDSSASVSFVATNSVTQGEQVATLWKVIFSYGVKITAAHQTFPWESEARGKAHVHVVIIEFDSHSKEPRCLVTYDRKGREVSRSKPRNISPYLTDSPTVLIDRRTRPFKGLPRVGLGSQLLDGGFLVFSPEEKDAFLAEEPNAEPYFRRWYGAEDFLKNKQRFCLYLAGASAQKLSEMKAVKQILQKVASFRAKSPRASTQKAAKFPHRFCTENVFNKKCIVIPKTSSERREYLPIGFLNGSDLASESLFVVEDSDLLVFGLLSSALHMTWAKAVAGRLKSDVRYSAQIVYNNFPLPITMSPSKLEKVREASSAILDFRIENPSSLAALYDPLSMPKNLLDSHVRLDRAVDALYGIDTSADGRGRLDCLFVLHQQLTQAEKKMEVSATLLADSSKLRSLSKPAKKKESTEEEKSKKLIFTGRIEF